MFRPKNTARTLVEIEDINCKTTSFAHRLENSSPENCTRTTDNKVCAFFHACVLRQPSTRNIGSVIRIDVRSVAVAGPTQSSRDDARVLERMAEEARYTCRAVTQRLQVGGHRPCLRSCAADSTPIVVSDMVVTALPSGRFVRLAGKATCEFLVVSKFMRSDPVGGDAPTAFDTCDPILQSVDQMFEVCRSRWLSLRQQGHSGSEIQL